MEHNGVRWRLRILPTVTLLVGVVKGDSELYIDLGQLRLILSGQHTRRINIRQAHKTIAKNLCKKSTYRVDHK